MGYEAVPDSADLQRIRALPRREWTIEQAEDLAKWLTRELTTAAGKAAGAALLAPQAVTLWEIYQNWTTHRTGVYGVLPPGTGKTLITYLAAYMIGARKPHLFTMANLRDNKTPKDFSELRAHWVTPMPLPRIEGYSVLQPDHALHLLEERAVDLVVNDECDKLRNPDSATSKRMGGHADMMRERCCFVNLTGTPQRNSIADDTHIATWSLREHAPVPLDAGALKDMCDALDSAKVVGDQRLHPGALLALADDMGVDPNLGMLERAREGYARRFEQTPGVIIWPYDSCDQPIRIRVFVAPEDEAIERAFFQYHATSCTPDGWPINDAIVKWNLERQLGGGFYYYYDPRPPAEWLVAKYQDAVFCRDMILRTRNYPRQRGATLRPLDTEDAVRRAFPDEEAIVNWRVIKKKYPKPKTKATWISGSVVHWAAGWAAQRHGRTAGIVWAEHQAMGEALAAITGLPFFGEEGLQLDAQGRVCGGAIDHFVEKWAPQDLPSIICLKDSNERGRNLPQYADNLCVGWHPSAEKVEQWMARTHRQKQTRPVNYDVLFTCGINAKSFGDTIAEARQVKKMKRVTQKILIADIDDNEAALLPMGSRWSIGTDDE